MRAEGGLQTAPIVSLIGHCRGRKGDRDPAEGLIPRGVVPRRDGDFRENPVGGQTTFDPEVPFRIFLRRHGDLRVPFHDGLAR